ncbi:hypothetical protein B0J11DRAFT_603259 [Dendryphion nanum]|uniref:F-box domain-containing protein n=1 Tax=Dendryphion nanum TaxID=256645 RepID=A0A9P9DX66_9PLEO|nr:hypothetical protein B0J11DRAFT_603259 [Dendryphion nanum]
MENSQTTDSSVQICKKKTANSCFKRLVKSFNPKSSKKLPDPTPEDRHHVNMTNNPFYQLPLELFEQIVSYIEEDKTDLLCLAASCRRFRYFLYSDILIVQRKYRQEYMRRWHRTLYHEMAALQNLWPQLTLTSKMLPCYFCERVHPKELFGERAYSIPVHNRRCIGSFRQLRICKHKTLDYEQLLELIRKFQTQIPRKHRYPTGQLALSIPLDPCRLCAGDTVLSLEYLSGSPGTFRIASMKILSVDVMDNDRLDVFKLDADLRVLLKELNIRICPHMCSGDERVIRDLMLTFRRNLICDLECSLSELGMFVDVRCVEEGCDTVFGFDDWLGLNVYTYRGLGTFEHPNTKEWLSQLEVVV